MKCLVQGQNICDFVSKSLYVSQAAVVAPVDLVDLRSVLGGAMNDVRLAVGAPPDHGAVVVGDVAAHRLVLLQRKVLAAPNEDAEKRGAKFIFGIGVKTEN